jgi:WD40 repeat protein
MWSVAFDGNTIVSNSLDETVRIWCAPFNTRDCKQVLHKEHFWARLWLCPAPNQQIVVSADNFKIHLDDIHTGARVCDPIEHKSRK